MDREPTTITEPHIKGIDEEGTGRFVHWTPTYESTNALCGEVAPDGFARVSETAYLNSPCPDCARRRRAQS